MGKARRIIDDRSSPQEKQGPAPTAKLTGDEHAKNNLPDIVTFTVYGTFLQGDARWWQSRNKGSRPPQPLLERWHRDRLNHDVVLLDKDQRRVVEAEIQGLCEFRG